MYPDFGKNKVAAYKLLVLESVITLIIALVFLVIVNVVAAYSALLGGLAYVIPGAWFVKRAFNDSDDVTPQMLINRFYQGEAGKLVLTAIFFALVFLLIEPLHIGALFLAFCVTMIVNLAGLANIDAGTWKK